MITPLKNLLSQQASKIKPLTFNKVTTQTFKLQVKNRIFKSNLFFNKELTNQPVVFISPGLGDNCLFENLLAKRLAQAGFASFVTSFMPPLEPFENMIDLNFHNEAYELSLKGIEELISLTKDLPFTNPSKIGLFGASLGGCFSALNCCLNPLISAVVMVAASGSNEIVLSQSENELVKKLKKTRLKHYNVPEEEYPQLINKIIQWDSLNYSNQIDPNKLLMFIATKDTSVPAKAQIKTWEAFGKPQAHFVNQGHYTTIALTPTYYYDKVEKFFTERLK